ncbi:putative LPS assembly protein LptD [Mucilaginibacter sp. AW1-3]
MKFITLFFLLTFISLTQVYSASNHYAGRRYFTVADTNRHIIKLDTVKDKNLLRRNGRKRTGKDTVKLNKVNITDTTKKNKEGLEDEIKSVAHDSSTVDKGSGVAYLWGAARVTYVDFALDADYIRVDQKSHLVFASGRINPKTHQYEGRPNFVQKGENAISADSMVYNYVTKKAKIYNVVTNQDGDYLSGGKARILNSSETAFSNVLFSTCDLPYPDTHFGIVIKKGIAEKHQIISGPAYLEIEGVPLPIFLPFGFFPKPDQKTSGFILPTFGEDQQLGFYLKGFGYYFAFSDYVDLTTLGTYYTKGSYELNSTAHYFKKYKYQGTLILGYGSHKYGLETDPPSRDFNVTWTHSQDPASNPGTTFSASVNAGTSSYYQNSPAQSNYNLQSLTQNNLRSSISYGKTWPGSPFNFTANLGHSQDITRKTITLELPTFSLNMTTLSPFEKKDQVGDKKWYQNLTIGYSLQGTNKLNSIPESQLFTANTFSKKFQNGFQQQIPIALNLTILRYFQFNSSVSYNERDYFQTIRKHYARGSISGLDSLVTDTVQGFKRGGDYSISSGFSTKVYGMLQFKGKIKAIRDVITPSVSFQYRPDFSDPKYGYYNTIVSNATVPYPYTSQTYSIFEQSVYGGPGGGKSAGLAISVNNDIEAKVRAGSSDTSGKDRNIPLIQGLSFSTFYNFVADSLKLSPISFSGHTALFNQKLGISFGGVLNPYVTQIRDSIAGGRLIRYAHVINQYTWQQGRFPMITSFNVSASMSFSSKSIKSNPAGPQQNVNTMQGINSEQARKLALINPNANAFVDFKIPWSINASYSFFYSNTGVSTTVGNTIQISGDLSVTPKWKVTYNSGIDLRAMQVSTSSIGIYRDLHCWDMSFQWIPFGYYKYYSVDLRVKASILQDLKLSKRKDYYNNN